jgi:hypothetical protein
VKGGGQKAEGRSGLRRTARAFLTSAFCLLPSAFLLAETLQSGSWRPFPAKGVDLTITRDHGRAAAGALRLDFDFHGNGGYAIARRDGAVDLPENFELSFWMRAEAPRNSLEVKFIDGESVWWNVRRELDYPTEWRRFSVKKRNVEFAWGPRGPRPLPRRVDAIEIVVTAGTGGKGTVWIDDVEMTPLDTAPVGTVPRIMSLPAAFDRMYEIGGLVIDWEKAPRTYDVVTDHETRHFETNGGRDVVDLPDTDTCTLDICSDHGAWREVRVLPPMRTDNDFFFAVAKESKRGDFPRYLYGQQSYWTVVGGTNGEEAEALLSEDGAIEAGNARFSVEPMLWIDDQLVTWNDVEVEQRPRPSVVWRKHLTVTPTFDSDVLTVRYQTAPNAKLFLAIRPFQVNTPWQFLKRTGGVVKIRSIAREGRRIVVDADERGTILASPDAFGVTTENVVEELRAGRMPTSQQAAGEYLSAAMSFDEHDVTIQIPLGGSSISRRDGSAPLDSPRVNSQPATRNAAIDVPAEPRIAQTIAAQLNYILINKDGPSLQPGSRSYERSWIRDGALTSAALLRLGHTAEVREFMEWYAKAIRPDGYVPCCVSTAGAPDPVPEHDSHGQFIYLVAEYYRHTRDRAEAESMWPIVRRVVAFIDKLRHERMTAKYEGTPFYGLVPESISHEGYSAKPVHSYWDDAFILRGLKDAAFLARELKKPEAAAYEAMRDELRRDLVASIGKTMQEHGIDYIPGSVELGDFDATSTTVAVSPGDEVDALPHAALLRTFDKYWEHALEPRTYTPYELRIVGTLVRLGRPERARRLLESFFEDQRPRAWHQWAEVVRRNPREPGFIGDMPHTWVGSDFIRSVTDFFAYESGDALILAAGVSKDWLGQGLCVSGLSTHYGMLSYSITAGRMHIDGGLRVPPGGIIVVSPLDGTRIIVRNLPADLSFVPSLRAWEERQQLRRTQPSRHSERGGREGVSEESQVSRNFRDEQRHRSLRSFAPAQPHLLAQDDGGDSCSGAQREKHRIGGSVQ